MRRIHFSKWLLIVVFVFGTAHGVRAQNIDQGIQVVDVGVDDATNNFTPQSYYDYLSNRTYVVWSGGIKDLGDNKFTSAMHVFIKYFDHASKRWSQTEEVFRPIDPTLLYGDGHYRQGVLVDNDGYIHVFQSYHIGFGLQDDGTPITHKIRHAISSEPSSIIAGWNIQDEPQTEYNTHGFYYKSTQGYLYGAFRKSYNVNFDHIYKKEVLAMMKSTNNGASFEVWDAIDAPHNETIEEGSGSPIAVHWGSIGATIKQDLDRNRLHVVFGASGQRGGYAGSTYYVIYNMDNDLFYGPNGAVFGNSITSDEYPALKQCCEFHIYDPAIFTENYGNATVNMSLDENGQVIIYYPVHKLDEPGTLKNYIHEYRFNGGSWNDRELTELGLTHFVADSVYVNPDVRYLITLPRTETTDGSYDPITDSNVYEWNVSSETWNLIQQVKDDKLQNQQSRTFRFATNFQRDIKGFFYSHDAYGYYDGVPNTKLFAFRFDKLNSTPVYNGNFEKGNTSGWTRVNLNEKETYAVKGTDNYYLKLVGENEWNRSGWTEVVTSPSTIKRSTDITYGGSSGSLTFSYVKPDVNYIQITKSITSSTNQIVRVAFYDRMGNDNEYIPTDQAAAFLGVTDGTNTTSIGVKYDPNKENNYFVRNNNDWYLTSVSRSVGWHIFEISVTPEGTSTKIDGLATIGSISGSSTLEEIAKFPQSSFTSVFLASTWKQYGMATFDEFSIRKYPENPTSTPLFEDSFDLRNSYLVSNWIDAHEDLAGKSVQLSFDARFHAEARDHIGFGVQRYPDYALSEPYYEPVYVSPVHVTTAWSSTSQTLTFPTDSPGIKTSKFRVVLRPFKQPYSQPLYVDKVKVDYLGDLQPPPKDGDVNGDGTINIFDFGSLMQFFGNLFDSPADLDSDRDVDFFDLTSFLTSFVN